MTSAVSDSNRAEQCSCRISSSGNWHIKQLTEELQCYGTAARALSHLFRMETKDLLGVEDGPSAALLRYMEAVEPAMAAFAPDLFSLTRALASKPYPQEPHQFEAPKDWHSMRDLQQPWERE